MPTRILTQPEVRALLPMARCMELVANALVQLARGNAQNPLRRGVRLDDGRLLGTMPGWLGEPQALGLKVVTVFPGNHGTRFDAHQGVVVLFELEHGRPLVILDASEITAIRTGAASGVATRALAREDAGDLAILGSGVQARAHLEAMQCARELRRVRVFSPNTAAREAFAAREGARLGLRVEAVDSARAAVQGADLVCTTTASTVPVLASDWLAPGAHVNAAGACMPKARELDTETVRRARVFVDCDESARHEAGDLLIPMAEGAIAPDHAVGELGRVLTGELEGRRSRDELTVFESLGIAVYDLAAAHDVHARALERGIGIDVELGGYRD